MAGFGETLREARLLRKISLQEAERATKIRQNFLAALEAERLDLLPARVYARGFLQTYARFLELDVGPLVAQLPPEPRPASAPRAGLAPRSATVPVWSFPAILFLVVALFISAYAFQRGATAGNAPAPLYVALSTPTPEPTPAPPASPTPEPTASATVTATVQAATATPIRATATGTAAARTPTAAPPSPTATGQAFVAVPAVVGRSQAEANQMLRAQGLNPVAEEQWSNTVPRGSVVDQAPAAGSQVAAGVTVTLIVSKGPQGPVMPNIVGRTEADARSMIVAVGLVPAQPANYQGRADLPLEVLRQVCVGCVLSSIPAPGQAVPAGTLVYLAVRKE